MIVNRYDFRNGGYIMRNQYFMVLSVRLFLIFCSFKLVHMEYVEWFVCPTIILTAVWEYALLYNKKKCSWKNPIVKVNYLILADIVIWSAVISYIIFTSFSGDFLGSMANLSYILFLSSSCFIGLCLIVLNGIFHAVICLIHSLKK